MWGGPGVLRASPKEAQMTCTFFAAWSRFWIELACFLLVLWPETSFLLCEKWSSWCRKPMAKSFYFDSVKISLRQNPYFPDGLELSSFSNFLFLALVILSRELWGIFSSVRVARFCSMMKLELYRTHTPCAHCAIYRFAFVAGWLYQRFIIWDPENPWFYIIAVGLF